MLDGVDVSYAQGNYHPGAESFVICNASRANVGLTVGSMYRQQVANARAAGKHVGHYFFNGNIDPTICADYFVNNLTYQPGDSLWLDVESEASTGTVAWSPAQALAFLARVKARTGVTPGVYLNRSLMDGFNWSTVVALGAPLWIAYYNPSPPPIKWWPDWTVWQYTSNPMDLNKAQVSLSAAALSATPIVESGFDMPQNWNNNGTIVTIGETFAIVWTNTSDFSYQTNMAAWGTPIIKNLTPDQLTTVVNERNAQGARLAAVGSSGGSAPVDLGPVIAQVQQAKSEIISAIPTKLTT